MSVLVEASVLRRWDISTFPIRSPSPSIGLVVFRKQQRFELFAASNMNASDLPYRSGRTDLTTAELVLCDFMFDSGVPRRFLEQDAYSVHMNVPYTHGLSSSQLDTTLADLCARGLLASAAGWRGRIEYALTTAGGSLWERERCPEWDAYVNAYEGSEEDGSAFLMVRATTLVSAEAFLATALRVGLHSPVAGTLAPWDVTNDDATLIYWKELPVVAFRAALIAEDEGQPRRVDWERYEQERTWWRNINELRR